MSLYPATHVCPSCDLLYSKCRCDEGKPLYYEGQEIWVRDESCAYNGKPGVVKDISEFKTPDNKAIYIVIVAGGISFVLPEDKMSTRYSGPLRQEILGKI